MIIGVKKDPKLKPKITATLRPIQSSEANIKGNTPATVVSVVKNIGYILVFSLSIIAAIVTFSVKL